VPLLQVSPAGQGDNKATFLAEFRALRERADLEYDELAARAHYPTDVLRNAEAGPGLPGLPVLAAYVRACGGDVAEWEERWRRLESPASGASGLPTRPAGATPAAVAGARASVSVTAADAHDPERIRAALRADQEREEQASRSSLTRADRRLSASAADPRRTTSGPATMIANGSHHKKPWPDGFDSSAAATVASGPAAPGSAVPGSGAEAPALETPVASAGSPSTEPVASAPAEEEFDAFRATRRWQPSSAAESWQAFDTGAASRPDTAWSTDTASRPDTAWSADKASRSDAAWSADTASRPEAASRPDTSWPADTDSRADTTAGSVWSPSASESSTWETARWRGASGTEQAADAGAGFTRSPIEAARTGSETPRAETKATRAEQSTRASTQRTSTQRSSAQESSAQGSGTQGSSTQGSGERRPSAQRSNHPVMLAVLVVLVLIGCIAVLVFT
jgi:hypothetical protein